MVRSVVLVVALGGCFGTFDANLHPAAAPIMSQVPDERRDPVFEAATARPAPEQRSKDLTKTERKVELAAAVAAALIGDALSYSHNVTIGFEGAFDETGNLGSHQTAPAPETGRLVFDPSSSELVPWVKAPSPTTDPAPPSAPAK